MPGLLAALSSLEWPRRPQRPRGRPRAASSGLEVGLEVDFNDLGGLEVGLKMTLMASAGNMGLFSKEIAS